MNLKDEIIEEFWEEFDGKGMIKCDIKECQDESCGVSTIAEWLRNKLSQYEETIKRCLGEEKETYKENKNLIYDTEQVGYNACRQEIINKLKEEGIIC